MDQTQRLDWEDEEEETPVERHRAVGNLHMFAGIHGPTQDFPIYPGPNVIGRHSSCDITLPAQSVSKKHAILDVTGDCHTICDNGSLNKTRRSKVALAPDVRYSLADGDFLLFADVACRYTIVKKIEVEPVAAEESEDDSMLVPGTQATLAIEKTPGAAIRRLGRGAVLARDSGDEDEEGDVRRGWNDGGEGGSKDSAPATGAFFSPAAETVVPESDEENDTSTSETHFPSLHLRCDSDTDNHEASRRESSFIPSSLNVFTPPAVKEPGKEETNRVLHINKEEEPVVGQTDEELKARSAEGKDATSDSGHLDMRSEAGEDGADERLAYGEGKVVSSDTVETCLKDGGTNDPNHSNGHENINSLRNDEENLKTPEVSSTSSHCLKDNEDETSERDVAATTVTESNPDGHSQAEEDNPKPTEESVKVEADLCLDSDSDADEETPIASGTDVKQRDDLEIQSDKEPEQGDIEALGTSKTSVHVARDNNVDEDQERTSEVQCGWVGEMNIDSDTDAEDDTEVSKTGNTETRTGNGNSNEVPEVDTILGTDIPTGLDIDIDTDVEDADITRSDEADQEPEKFVEEKKEHLDLDSDTDVEDNVDVSSAEVKKVDSDSMAADVSAQETAVEIRLDTDADVKEDVHVCSTDVVKETQALNEDAKEDFHVDSDTDVEDGDVSSTVATKEKQDLSNSVQNARGLPMDGDAGAPEEDQKPGPSSAAVESGTAAGGCIDEQVETVKNDEDAAGGKDKEAAELHSDSDTDLDEDERTSTGPAPEKPGGPIETTAEKTEAAALLLDSDTDVDEDDASLGLDKCRTAERVHSDGNLEKAPGSSCGEMSGAAKVPGAPTNTVRVESRDTREDDSQDDDYELAATQCYLKPQEPETDLPDEEATQAYIMSSTWAEPDPFKRPSDPVGVLQISAVTLDKSEEEVDENTVAETQLFCFEMDQSPGPGIQTTPVLEEEAVDNQQETQRASSVEASGKEAQPEVPQGAISQEDTEPVSQCLSAKPPDETGTWLHLKRDVPTSVWIKGLQEKGETSAIQEASTEDDLTQDELDLPLLELEATQSYILEVPNVQKHPIPDHTTSALAVQEDHTKLGVSAVPVTENPPKDPVNLETGVLAVPATKSSPTGSSTPETDVPTMPSTESTPAEPSIPETVLLAEPATEGPPTASNIPDTGVCNLHLAVLSVPATESPPKELNNMETQVTDDDATQVCSLNLPASDVMVPLNNLGVPSTEDATQPCSSNMEDPAGDEVQSSSVTMLEEEKNNMADTGKGKPVSRRGLSRSRKKGQSEKSTEISAEKAQPPEQAAPSAHSSPEGKAELGESELEESAPKIVVSAVSEAIEPEKAGRRRGGRRTATEVPEKKTQTMDELVSPAASRKRVGRTALEAEPSTSGVTEARRKQLNRKSAVKRKEEEEKQDLDKDSGSTSEKCRGSDVPEALPENPPEKIGLGSEGENVVGPTSMETIVSQVDGEQVRDLASASLEPSGNGENIVVKSTENPDSEKSRILDVPEQSETISAPQKKKPGRGRRPAATKAKADNREEMESNDAEDMTETETSGISEKQHDFKVPTSRTSDSQDAVQENPIGKRTRRSNISTTDSLEKEKARRADAKVSQNEEANKTCPDNQTSGSTRSIRQRRNVKEEVQEDSQTEEQSGRLPSKRATSLRGDPKNKDRNGQQAAEEQPGSSPLSKRTRRHSKEETPKPGQEATEVGKTEEENTVQLPRRTRKGCKEEKKTEDGEGSPESSSTAKAQRTRRGSREQAIVDQEETVKETVTRKRRNSKAEETQLEDQSKRSVKTRRLSKEEVVEETSTDDKTAGQNTTRRTRRNEKTASEPAGDQKPSKELSQSERSSSRTRRKASAEDSEKLLENTEVKEELSKGAKDREDEPSAQETPRKGRTRRTSVKEEPPQVSTPVASRKRGQASKADVELKRKKSDETQEAVEVRAGRRGRPRKLTTTEDSQTSAGGGREVSTPEPSSSRSNRQGQSPVSSSLEEARTPRRTGRLSASTLASSPYVPHSGVPPKVLFTGVVDAMGEEIIRSLGGDIADSVFDCTHLITDSVRRTVKFLCALARGIPIVTLDWIDKCKKSGCFLSPTKFLVKDQEQEKSFNFVLSESLQKAKKRPLFEGYEIHVTPSVKPDPELMKDIICCSGATFLPKMPRTFKERCVIVSCSKDASRCKSVPSRTPITTAEFILSGILRQEINPSAYLLSNATEESSPAPAKRRR